MPLKWLALIMVFFWINRIKKDATNKARGEDLAARKLPSNKPSTIQTNKKKITAKRRKYFGGEYRAAAGRRHHIPLSQSRSYIFGPSRSDPILPPANVTAKNTQTCNKNTYPVIATRNMACRFSTEPVCKETRSIPLATSAARFPHAPCLARPVIKRDLSISSSP